MNLSLLIPAYNEYENILVLPARLFPVLVDLAREYTVELVLVDDGSRDLTWEAIQSVASEGARLGLPVITYRHERNQGLGAALRTGFASATGEVVITTDSDGTYAFGEIPGLLKPLQPGIDLVTASPYHPQGGVAGVPRSRLLLSKGASFLYRRLLGRSLHTYTAMFRAYRRKYLNRISFQSDDYLAITELLVGGLLAGCQVAEYPTVLHRRKLGASKARILRVMLDHIGFMGRIALHRLGIVSLDENSARVKLGRGGQKSARTDG